MQKVFSPLLRLLSLIVLVLLLSSNPSAAQEEDIFGDWVECGLVECDQGFETLEFIDLTPSLELDVVSFQERATEYCSNIGPNYSFANLARAMTMNDNARAEDSSYQPTTVPGLDDFGGIEITIPPGVTDPTDIIVERINEFLAEEAYNQSDAGFAAVFGIEEMVDGAQVTNNVVSFETAITEASEEDVSNCLDAHLDYFECESLGNCRYDVDQMLESSFDENFQRQLYENINGSGTLLTCDDHPTCGIDMLTNVGFQVALSNLYGSIDPTQENFDDFLSQIGPIHPPALQVGNVELIRSILDVEESVFTFSPETYDSFFGQVSEDGPPEFNAVISIQFGVVRTPEATSESDSEVIDPVYCEATPLPMEYNSETGSIEITAFPTGNSVVMQQLFSGMQSLVLPEADADVQNPTDNPCLVVRAFDPMDWVEEENSVEVEGVLTMTVTVDPTELEEPDDVVPVEVPDIVIDEDNEVGVPIIDDNTGDNDLGLDDVDVQDNTDDVNQFSVPETDSTDNSESETNGTGPENDAPGAETDNSGTEVQEEPLASGRLEPLFSNIEITCGIICGPGTFKFCSEVCNLTLEIGAEAIESLREGVDYLNEHGDQLMLDAEKVILYGFGDCGNRSSSFCAQLDVYYNN